MNRSHAYRLLLVIKNKLSIDEMLILGMDYYQIARLLSDLFDQGLVVDAEENGIVLTPKGRNFLVQEARHSKEKSLWIMPKDIERIGKIDINEIYLPRKKK